MERKLATRGAAALSWHADHLAYATSGNNSRGGGGDGEKGSHGGEMFFFPNQNLEF